MLYQLLSFVILSSYVLLLIILVLTFVFVLFDFCSCFCFYYCVLGLICEFIIFICTYQCSAYILVCHVVIKFKISSYVEYIVIGFITVGFSGCFGVYDQFLVVEALPIIILNSSALYVTTIIFTNFLNIIFDLDGSVLWHLMRLLKQMFLLWVLIVPLVCILCYHSQYGWLCCTFQYGISCGHLERIYNSFYWRIYQR